MGGKRKSAITSLHILFGACVLALAAFYLFEVNSIVKDNFALENLEKEIGALREKSEVLQVRASEVQSLTALREKSAAFGLEEVKKVFYIHTKQEKALGLTSL